MVHKGNGVQIIYGPRVTVIKSNLEHYLDMNIEEYDENDAVVAQDLKDSALQGAQDTKGEKPRNGAPITICSPISGVAAQLSTAPDEAFAGGMMGAGAVITPTDPIVRAPEDATIGFVFDTKHAIGLETDSGVSLLIHVGIDTVNLNGQGFKALVKNGQKVKKGTELLRLDLDFLSANAPSLVSPVLCTELEPGWEVRLLKEGTVQAGEPLFEIVQS